MLNKTSPWVGSMSRRRSLPSVVFPQPLSPTSATVSPRWIARSTPSTAWTFATVRWRSPPLTAKCFVRPRAASRISFRSLRSSDVRRLLVVQMASDLPVRAWREEQWFLEPATFEGELASRMEAAAGGRIQQVGDHTGDRGERGARLELTGLRRDDGLEQPLRVRVERLPEEIRDRGILDDLSGIHRGDSVAELRDDGQVVGDVEDRGVDPFLQVLQEPENLGLGRDVERGRGFVRNHEGGLAGQCHGDHHTLLHPPLSSCGYAPYTFVASGIRTSRSRSRT